MAKERTFLDTKQLAQRWRRSPRTVEGWRARKTGPDYLDLNGKIVYDLDEVIRERMFFLCQLFGTVESCDHPSRDAGMHGQGSKPLPKEGPM